MQKKIIVAVALVLGSLIIVFLAGPRTEIDLQLKTVTLPADLDRYLAESEARYPDLIPGTEKTIRWANPDKTKTSLAIVYLHGYSASRQETAPLSDQLAARLGANLFYTRYTGHGQTGAALAQASINDFLNDTLEAIEIGKRLGDKVIVIGTSNGGVLATWLALQPDQAAVLAYVLISPNFGARDPAAVSLTWPWGRHLVPLIVGPEYGWTPQNAREAQYWTTHYPSSALAIPVNLSKFVREARLEKIQTPVLVIYSPNDQVVQPATIEQAYTRFSSTIKQIVPITDSENPEAHVLAGDILAPGDTGRIADIIFEFIAALP